MEHLHKLGIENFRLFKKMQEFDFAPITVFTGVNNSGKSSVIKSLLLLKDSFNKSTNFSELLFTESKHNLGSLLQCINNQNKSEKYLKFKLPLPLKYFDNDCSIELEYKPNSDFAENGTLRAFKIFYQDKEFVNFSRNLELEEVERLISEQNAEYLHNIVVIKIDINFLLNFVKNKSIDDSIKKLLKSSKRKLTADEIRTARLKLFSFDNQLNKEIELTDEIEGMNSSFNSFFKNSSGTREKNDETKETHNPTLLIKTKTNSENAIDETLKNEFNLRINEIRDKGITISNADDSPNISEDSLFNLYLESVENLVDNYLLSIDSDIEIELSGFGEQIFSSILIESIQDSFELLNETIKGIYSLSSLRGNTERLYTNNSDIVDINNIIIQFLESNVYLKGSSIEKFINNSLKMFNIGDKLSIIRHQGVASEVFIHRGIKKILLADLGFGYTQLLPIILKVAIIANERMYKLTGLPVERFNHSILILEEPESNLHPSFQSKLADLIKEAACKFNIQFIIETHSEYFIRKLQFIVAKKELQSRDISLFYFQEPNSLTGGEKQVRKIEIRKDGLLSSEFGSGFFDEADNLASKLYILNKNSSN